ncbi:DUF4249 family protein [Maribacter sp. 2-571]|uniref:DUF4249 family protein n=1 Tax=Maribacter sp. 2-571 TaxID=3417569 RepID=UPI003D34A281
MRVYAILFCIVLAGMSCEDVIDVDVPSEPPRLSIDALLRLNDTTAASQTVQVRASLTSSFFGDVVPTSLESIVMTNPDYVPQGPEDSNTLLLNEIAPGLYEGNKATDFFTQGTISLSISHEGQRYLATTAFAPAAPIDRLSQGDGNLFSEEETEVVIAFTDDIQTDNFYVFDFDFNEYLVSEDEFYQGQTFEFSYFYDDGVAPGMEITVEILGADRGFYNYMNQLIAQSDGGAQGPFQTPSATVRGNVVNVTNSGTPNASEDVDNFALGYFAISQTFTQDLLIE